MIFIPLICAVGLIGFCIFMILSGWDVHKSMVKTSCNSYGKANFNKFVEEFNKVDWKYNPDFKYSLFSYDHKDKYHASIIMFNNNGMIMSNPISYIKVRIYVKKYLKEKFNVGEQVNEWR